MLTRGTENASNSTTTFTWKAKPLDNLHFAEAFHFRLQKGDGDVFCDGCIASSVEIRVSNIVNTETSVVADGKSGNDGLGSQDKLMIGLSIGIASAVIAGFITLMCCTQKYVHPFFPCPKSFRSLFRVHSFED